MPYLNVDEVESAIELAAESNPDLTELIHLPHPTWEGRTSTAIRVHKGSEGSGVALGPPRESTSSAVYMRANGVARTFSFASYLDFRSYEATR